MFISQDFSPYEGDGAMERTRLLKVEVMNSSLHTHNLGHFLRWWLSCLAT
jgi:hypothetical protein